MFRTDVKRYFLDTEFYEDGETIDLISIGIVDDEGREFYRANSDARLHRVSPWVRENVLPQLPPYGPLWAPKKAIRDGLKKFIDERYLATQPIEFWAYYADYDWVALCQLFGTMMDLPDHFPKFCMDLKQLSVHVGSPKHTKQKSGEHNALEDAWWNSALFDFLRKKHEGK